MTSFTRQILTLLEAGMPIQRGVETLRNQERNRSMRKVLDGVLAAIENGSSFAEALAMHPRVFGRFYLNMIRAGEAGGVLEVTLRRLTESMEKAQRVRRKVAAALFYPCVVLLVAVGVLGVMMVYVVPRFKAMFDGMLNGAPLPPITLALFKISEVLSHHAFLAGILAVLASVALTAALATQSGRFAFDYLKLQIPIVGLLLRNLVISRFTRTLGTLAASGVPILQALAIARETAGNAVLGRLIAAVEQEVRSGNPISPLLRDSSLFPALVVGMVDVGEETGALPEMLVRIADQCDVSVDNMAGAITSLLEPILLLILAVVVGSIIFAMFLPLVQLMNGLETRPGAHGRE